MKPFVIFLGLVALLVAGCAAFFSVKGIGLLFAGAAIETMVMASILEIAKLVATSYLYRYWKSTSKFLRYYLLVAVLTLMAITSLGIFGFLSSAYQKSSSEFGVYTAKIQMIEQEKKYVTDQMDTSSKRIDSLTKNRNDSEQRMTDAQAQAGKTLLGSQVIKLQNQTSNIIDGISKDISSENEHMKSLQSQAQAFDQQEVELKAESQSSKDIITFQFIADAVGLSLNTVVKYFIFIIIIVFDPLAVGLILAYNTAIYGSMNKDEEEIKPSKSKPLPPPLPPKETIKEVIREVEVIKEVPKEVIKEVIKEIEVVKDISIEKETELHSTIKRLQEELVAIRNTPSPTTSSIIPKEDEHVRFLQEIYRKYSNKPSDSNLTEGEIWRVKQELFQKIKEGRTQGMTVEEIDRIRQEMSPHSQVVPHAGWAG